MWLLVCVAVAEGGVFLWQQARVEALLDRMLDVQTLAALELDSRLGLLVMLDESSAGLSYDDLRVMQARGASWLAEHVQRHGHTPEQAALLQGVLSRYLADYAGERLAQVVRSPGTPVSPREVEQTRRFFRAVAHILGDAGAATFEQEIRAVWGTWLP